MEFYFTTHIDGHEKMSAMHLKDYSTITRICQLICSKIPKENNSLLSEAWFVNLFSIIIDFSLTIFFRFHHEKSMVDLLETASPEP